MNRERSDFEIETSPPGLFVQEAKILNEKANSSPKNEITEERLHKDVNISAIEKELGEILDQQEKARLNGRDDLADELDLQRDELQRELLNLSENRKVDTDHPEVSPDLSKKAEELNLRNSKN